MKNILCVVLLFWCVTGLCQSTPKKDLNKVFDDNFKQYSQKIDSSHKADYQKFKTKSDSLHSAQYLNQLERAILVDTAKDTYYGTVFSGIAVAVTIVILFFGFNVWQSRQEAKRQIKKIALEAKASLDTQNKVYIEAFEAIKKTALEFQAEYQKDLDEALKAANDKLAVIGTTVDTTTQQKIDELKMDIEKLTLRNNLRKDVSISNLGPIKAVFKKEIVCRNPDCRRRFAYNPNSDIAMVETESNGKTKKEYRVTCPHCGIPNITATAFIG